MKYILVKIPTDSTLLENNKFAGYDCVELTEEELHQLMNCDEYYQDRNRDVPPVVDKIRKVLDNALSKKQVAFLYDLEYDTAEEVKRFINIINDGYHRIYDCQLFIDTTDRIKFDEDYDFMMTMLGVK